MIQDGCLEGVDEVYGMHNIPVFTEGDVRTIPGVVSTIVTYVKITINGQGGHSSTPQFVNDVISATCQTQVTLNAIQARMTDVNLDKYIFTLCKINGGTASNVFPNECTMEGMIRCWSQEVNKRVQEKISQIVEHVPRAYGCEGKT